MRFILEVWRYVCTYASSVQVMVAFWCQAIVRTIRSIFRNKLQWNFIRNTQKDIRKYISISHLEKGCHYVQQLCFHIRNAARCHDLFGQFEWRHLINDGESPIAEETHYSDVIICATASQITSLTIVYSTVYSGADRRKHQSSASLAYVLEIYRWPVNSLHRWPVTRKMFPFDDVIMQWD